MIVVKKEDYKPQNGNTTVVVMTSLSSFNRSYSLTTVIIDQLRALVIAGYKVKFWVTTVCDLSLMPPDIAQTVEVQKVMPTFRWKEDEVDENGAKDIKNALDKYLFCLESAVVITHDLMFIDSFVTFAHVAHSLIPNSKFKWLHCCHSSVSARPEEGVKRLRSSLPQGHKIICLNKHLASKFATYYGTTIDKIIVVNNSRDIRAFLRFPEEIWDLVHRSGALSADIVQTFSFSTMRAESKGLEHVIKIFGMMKKFQLNVKLILLNAHAVDPKAKDLIEKYKKMVDDCGLKGDVTWYSDEFKNHGYIGASESIVSSFLQISNVFIFPTISEAGPLALMEAALSGCLLVLNRQVQPLLDYTPNWCGLYYDFNENTHQEIAKNIAHYLSNNISNLSKRHTLRHNNILSMSKQLQTAIGKF